MSRATKIWLITATFLVLIGSIVFVGVMTVLEGDFMKLSTGRYESNTYEVNEGYKNISFLIDTADVKLVPSENLKSSVVCYEQNNVKHSVNVKDDTLVIEVVDTRKWYEHIGIFFGTPKITVYVPQGEYGTLSINGSTGDVEIPKELNFESMAVSLSTGDVKNCASASKNIKISTSTGDIYVENISSGALELSVSTGQVTVSDVMCDGDVNISVSTGKTSINDMKCQNIISNGNTGDMVMKNVIANEKLDVERTTGDVKLDGCDANEICISTDTGNVTGSLLTDKVFIAHTDTGKVDVPKTALGGKCEITTDTGDIKITVE